jgi:1-deoxy-D-xylulose-5-phosphate synthase
LITLLERINNPDDMRSLDDEQLNLLADEIREFLIDSVSKTGGHFGANLGVVELTIALHKVFMTPRDKLVWDVGHQAYVHKLLTGRSKFFHSLRQFGGISGFPKRTESEYDAFGTGHASTSVSAALGMAVARDLSNDDYKVVAVIGDGALTGGAAMEAMNHAGHLGTDLIVVLNDNGMSIAENVGAVSKNLNKSHSNGQTDTSGTECKTWFEGFGFQYRGPVDGHNLHLLIAELHDAKQEKGPILLHVITEKGKGHAGAEKAQDKYHAWPANGTGKKPSYSSVFAQTLIELAKNDERIVAVTAAMPNGTGLKEFAGVFPKRFFDVGIAEQHAATFCAGLASAGKKPVFAVYSTFLQRAYDQVIHDIAIQNLPVVIAVDRAGLVGPDGETHQGVFDLSFLRPIPNLTVMMPKNGQELRNMLKTAFTIDGPVIVRYPRADVMDEKMNAPCELLPVGHAEVVLEGFDGAFLALGPMVDVALNAASELHLQFGISMMVVNLRFVKPLDTELIKQIGGSGMPIITVEEASATGGIGSGILEILTDAGISPKKVKRLGISDKFIEHGTRRELLAYVGLSVNEIVRAVQPFFVHNKAEIQRIGS